MVLIWLSSQQQQSCQKNTLGFLKGFFGDKPVYTCISILETCLMDRYVSSSVFNFMIHPHFQIWRPCLFLIPGHIKCSNKFEAHSTQFDCYVKCNAPNSDSSITNLLSKFYQNCMQQWAGMRT
jgi:hypothetical protein